MRIAKIIAVVLLFVLLAAIVAAGLMFWQANRAPEGYRPPVLTAAQREVAAKAFINGQLAGREGFISNVNSGQPFTLSATQEQINAYLASMDEIAAMAPKGQAGQVHAAMDKIGIASPMVELSPGKVRVMVQATQLDKVLSADIGVVVTPGKELKLNLERAMVGRATVPKSMVAEKLAGLQRVMQKATASASSQPVGLVTVDELGTLLRLMVTAVGGEPVSLTYHDRVRVDSIQITDDCVSVHIVPLRPATMPAN